MTTRTTSGASDSAATTIHARATASTPAKASRTGAALALAATLVACGGVSAAANADQDCEFRKDVNLQTVARGSLWIDAGAGRLTIRGDAASDQVRVVATLCASDEERLEQLGVTLDDDRLETSYPRNRGGWGRRYARIDMEIALPAATQLEVEDGSGSLTISGVESVELEDGAGSIAIESVGSVVLRDGSGSMRIRDVAGDVEVEDGSGSLSIQEVGGGVLIRDGSGSISVEGVGGSVRIDEVGSGSVSVRDVAGDLVVTDGRRERIRYTNVRGTVDLPPARKRGQGD